MIERSVRLARSTSSTTSVVLLVGFNLVPLVGVVFWGWNVATILVLYWAENGIIGAHNVPKMLLARGPDVPGQGFARAASAPTGSGPASRIGSVIFFLIHYGMFWFVHGIFVFTLPFFVGGVTTAVDGGLDLSPGAFPGPDGFGDPLSPVVRSGPDLAAVGWAVLGLAISRIASFLINFVGCREYLAVSPAAQMFAPYGRLVILHMTIILGAFVSLMLGSPVGAIVVLVILKTAVDLALHLREHRGIAVRVDPA